MGTGLFLFLENKSSLNYLITEKVNGLVWSDHSLETEIVKLIKNKSFFNEFSRDRRIQHNKMFSYLTSKNFTNKLKNLKSTKLKIGISEVDITPTMPTDLGGYNSVEDGQTM